MRIELPTIPVRPMSRRRNLVGLAVAMFVAIVVSIACSSAAATPNEQPTTAIDPTITPTSQPSGLPRVDAFAVLEEFLDELGPRQSATEQEEAAARYIQSRFQEMGYATELQPFPVEDISLAGLGLTLHIPQPKEYIAIPMEQSGLGSVSGLLAPVGLAMSEEMPAAGLEGRIALAKRGVISFQSKAENVFAAGAVGLVVYNNVGGRFRGILSTQPEFPVVSLSRQDGEDIETLLAESEIDATIELTLQSLTSRNVIAEKKGSTDAVVVLGAHYDSVEGISGANDNASGTAVLLAIAESLKEVDLPFTLRFVAFGSEELGLLGSGFYVEELSEEELDQTKGMLNFDAVGSGSGVSVFGGSDFTGLASEAGTDVGVDIAVTRGISGGSSDFARFELAGVPYMMYFGDDFSRLHSERDTLEFVQPELLTGIVETTVAMLQSQGFADLINSD